MVAARHLFKIDFNVFFQSLISKPLGSTNDLTLHYENTAKQLSVGSSRDFPPCQPQESSITDDNFIPPPPSLGMLITITN